MKPTVFEDPCPKSGHSMQDYINRLFRKVKNSRKEQGEA